MPAHLPTRYCLADGSPPCRCGQDGGRRSAQSLGSTVISYSVSAMDFQRVPQTVFCVEGGRGGLCTPDRGRDSCGEPRQSNGPDGPRVGSAAALNLSGCCGSYPHAHPQAAGPVVSPRSDHHRGAPNIPVGVRGTYRVWPLGTCVPHRGPITVQIGNAIASQGPPTRENQVILGTRMMETIAILAEQSRGLTAGRGPSHLAAG